MRDSDQRGDDGTTGGSGGTDAGASGGSTSVGGSSSTGGSTATGGASTGGTSTGGSTATGGTPPIVEDPPTPGTIEVTPVTLESGPTRWKYDATAAYSLIHDDTCDSAMTSHYQIADPELTQRGLKAGFGAISGFCEGDTRLTTYFETGTLVKQWEALKGLVENGHEIVNHTWSHVIDYEPNGLPFTDASRWQMEIDRGREQLETNLGVDVDYLIFPYDEKTDEQLSYLATQGYAGGRGGERNKNGGVNPFDFADPYRVDFAVYTREEGPTPTALNAVIDGAIAWGGWGIREIHGISDTGEGWEPVPIAQYKAHLDYAKQKVDAGELWMDGPARVTKYRFGRDACPQPTITGRTLSFSGLSADCIKYATELTFVLQTNGAASELVAIQGTAYVETTPLGGGRFFLHVNPAKGDVDLSGN